MSYFSLSLFSSFRFQKRFFFLLLCAVFKEHNENGGDERDRTADPLLARQVLSQLSYAPIIKKRPDFRPLTALRMLQVRTFFS